MNCKSSMWRKLNSNLESLERLAGKEFEWIFCSIRRFWCVGYTSVVLKNDHGGRMKMTLLVFALLFVGSLAGCSGKHVCKDRITNNTAVYFFGMCSGAWFSLGMRLVSTPLVVASPSSNQRSYCLFPRIHSILGQSFSCAEALSPLYLPFPSLSSKNHS